MAPAIDYPLFIGCLLIAFSPVIFMLFLVIAKRAQLVIITVTSAFIWLVSLLACSVIWVAIPPLKENVYFIVPVGVVVQEAFRILLFKLYTGAERKIKEVTSADVKLPLNDLSSGIAAGVGFAIMQSTIMYGSLLANTLNVPGVHYQDSCTNLPVVVVAALNALAFSVMQIALSVVAFVKYRRAMLSSAGFVGLLHMFVALATLFNKMDNGCTIALPLVFVGTGMTLLFALMAMRKLAL